MSLLEDLRRLLARHRLEPDLDGVARALGLSVRSLQRRLREHRTSFAREVTVARVRHAQKLMMIENDTSLSRVALDSGFSSPAQLSIAFRKVEGMTPSAWRKGIRRATRGS